MFYFSERSGEFTETNIFTILERKRQERLAKGLPVYNLSVGTPDFPPAPHIMKAVQEAAADPEQYKYALSDAPAMTEAVARWYSRRYQVELSPNEIMSVAGSQEGIAHFSLAVLNPGDVLLAPNPGYPIFEIGPRLMGARTALYDLLPEKDYLPDLDEIARTMPPNARAIIVSYPANPLGATAPASFYKRLVEFAREHKLWVIHDNAYSEITFGGEVGGSFLSTPGAKEVGVEFNSLSKTYNLTGTRISYLMGNSQFIRRFCAIRSQFDYGLCRIFQAAAIAALNGPQDAVIEQRAEYERRRDALCGGFRSIGWDMPDAKGTMFAWGKLPGGRMDDAEFVMELIERSGVIVTPGNIFGSRGRGYVRFALTLPVSKIEQAVAAVSRSGLV
ncbi:MAG: aminotransferase class I/II-fold pyridoxal phosphate-dependent enzyme [Oscillospiraceae bacterium]|jgi:LL-diaminopimelate aminotransferase|nr:aminotransferase class I/II-fold pyridoxal phosphate-dependent enzyme [Oscillospiraceae bacterium]